MKTRIKAHRRVLASDLVPHELNARVHTQAQRDALKGLYEEIGFARSLLVYELPDGRLKLIDGHLRADVTPNELVDVEVLDVNDEEARVLLLAIDPLAELALYDTEKLEELRNMTEHDSGAVAGLWHEIDKASIKTKAEIAAAKKNNTKKQIAAADEFWVLIKCTTEREQLKLFRRLKAEGLPCTLKIA